MISGSTGPAAAFPPFSSSSMGDPQAASPVDSTASFTPTEFITVVNQTLEYAYSPVLVTGEVASFKVNQGKWVFFDLKDEESSVSCFMTLWSLRVPLEDGMKVVVRAVPKLTKWGKFSLTVEAVKPVGEGSLKKAYEMLKKKLTAEGLFDQAKKRKLPEDITRIGVISSRQAAGYADFIKIINARWGGMKVEVAHTQVQGIDAPDQMIRALKYFNERGKAQVIALIRGGGSADDLSCFNDEKLVREIAVSKIPVITGIGHEVDESLADLAADVRASTPSNAAEMLTKDRKVEREKLRRSIRTARQAIFQEIDRKSSEVKVPIIEQGQRIVRLVDVATDSNREQLRRIMNLLRSKYLIPMLSLVQEKTQRLMARIQEELARMQSELLHQQKLLEVLNPEKVLKQGYAILAGKISPGERLKITTSKQEIDATITNVKERN